HATAGRITRDALASLALPVDANAYLCGPTAFMSAVRDALLAVGVSAPYIHTELFDALGSLNPGVVDDSRRAPHQPDGGPRTGPLATFARTAIPTPSGAETKSVLDLADECDVNTRWSCRTGVCHPCVTPLLSGDISYEPAPLELPADGEVLICCAR